MSQIFLSHSRDDKEHAEKLAAALLGQGWSVWSDSASPIGERFADVIDTALAESECVIVLWSKTSVSSTLVGAEARVGMNRNIIIPVLVEDTTIPFEYQELYTADLIGWDGKASDPAFQRLSKTVEAMVGAPGMDSSAQPEVPIATKQKRPPPPPSSRPEPQQQKNPRSKQRVQRKQEDDPLDPLKDGYLAIRVWYRDNIDAFVENHEPGDKTAEAALGLVKNLPPPSRATRLDKRLTLAEVRDGVLEWGSDKSDGHQTMRWYALRGLDASGGSIIEEEVQDFEARSKLFPYSSFHEGGLTESESQPSVLPEEPAEESPEATGSAVHASDRARFQDDQLRFRDSLDVKEQADTFARLFASRDTRAPVALGLFGNWGTGKSYFMRLMRERLLGLTEESRDEVNSPYVNRVAQIEFNAWHYSDANLWANLALQIYDGLAVELDDLAPNKGARSSYLETRAQLRRRVHSSREEHERLLSLRASALDRRQETETKLADKEAERSDTWRERAQLVWARLRKAAGNETNIREIEKVTERFGLDPAVESIEELQDLGRELKALQGTTVGLLKTLGLPLRSARARGVSVVIAIVVLFIGVQVFPPIAGWIALVWPAAQGWVANALALLTEVLPSVYLAVRLGRTQLSKVADAVGRIDQVVQTFAADTDATPPDQEAKLSRRIEALDTEITGYETALVTVAGQLTRSESELQRIEAGGLVYDLAADRLRDDRYTKELGILAVIREDFDHLATLIAEWKTPDEKLQTSSAKPVERNPNDLPIQRIVLYLDDLDRCPPERVVEVLQAVHLLLATPLFLVVVAVDARWLERALYQAYSPESLQEYALVRQPNEMRRAPKEVARLRWAGLDDLSIFSPQNYLEKIFQIPYSLPPMSKAGFVKLIDDLVVTQAEYEEQRKQRSAEEARMARSDVGGEVGSAADREAGEDVEATTAVVPLAGDDEAASETKDAAEGAAHDDTSPDLDVDRAGVLLTDREQAYMQALYGFVDTPRLTKRMVNIYYLLRVFAARRDLKRFVESPDEEFRAAMILLAINLGFPRVGARLLRVLETDRDSTVSFTALLDMVADGRLEETSVFASDKRLRDGLAVILTRVSELNNDAETQVPDDLSVYRQWAPIVGQYSFHWHLDERA